MVNVYTSLFTNTWLLWIALVLPFLAALIGLVISIITIIQQQHNPLLTLLKRYITGAGAILELLIAPFVFLIAGILGAKISVGSGLALLILGSLLPSGGPTSGSQTVIYLAQVIRKWAKS